MVGMAARQVDYALVAEVSCGLARKAPDTVWRKKLPLFTFRWMRVVGPRTVDTVGEVVSHDASSADFTGSP